jgi:hypothetical protein
MQSTNAESERCGKDRPQAHVFGFLKANLGHFSPGQIMDNSCQSTGSRVDGLFGVDETLLRHEVLLLAVAVKRIGYLGQMVHARRFCVQIPLFSPRLCHIPTNKNLDLSPRSHLPLNRLS